MDGESAEVDKLLSTVFEKTESVEAFLESVFGFLGRHTDFFRDAPNIDAAKTRVRDSFNNQWAIRERSKSSSGAAQEPNIHVEQRDVTTRSEGPLSDQRRRTLRLMPNGQAPKVEDVLLMAASYPQPPYHLYRSDEQVDLLTDREYLDKYALHGVQFRTPNGRAIINVFTNSSKIILNGAAPSEALPFIDGWSEPAAPDSLARVRPKKKAKK